MVVILLDDTGFAQLGSFGSDIATPNMDRLAGEGLRYNRFHVTALCSPSRASLLTGRNHHAVGMGFLCDTPTGFPGYTSRLPKTAATLPRLLRDAGYSTMAVGKWHLTPAWGRCGHSSATSTFADPDAPEVRTTQYFEMLGSRSIYHDGWKATTDHVTSGVFDEALLDGSRDLDDDRRHLFRVESDFAPARARSPSTASTLPLLHCRKAWVREAFRSVEADCASVTTPVSR